MPEEESWAAAAARAQQAWAQHPKFHAQPGGGYEASTVRRRFPRVSASRERQSVRLLTLAQAARRLGTTEDLLRGEIDSGAIAHVALVDGPRIREQDLAVYIAARVVPPRPGGEERESSDG